MAFFLDDSGSRPLTANWNVGSFKLTGLSQGTSSGEALHAGRQVSTGTGLTGGGALTSDRTLSLDTTYTDGRYLNTSGDTWSGQQNWNFFLSTSVPDPTGNNHAVNLQYADATYQPISDQRLKKDITPITGALDLITSLRGVNYKWNAEAQFLRVAAEDTPSSGLIAQEVEMVAPWAVKNVNLGHACSGNGGNCECVVPEGLAVKTAVQRKFVDYERFTGYLIEAIKELKAQIDSLDARITAFGVPLCLKSVLKTTGGKSPVSWTFSRRRPSRTSQKR